MISDHFPPTPFERFISSETLHVITELRHGNKGAFRPYSGFIFMNCNFDEWKQQLSMLVVDAPGHRSMLEDADDSFLSAYGHEMVHTYNIMGSSIGAIHNICSVYSCLFVEKFFEKKSFPKKISLQQFRDLVFKLGFDSVDEFTQAKLLIEVMNLFSSLNYAEYLPQLKDYNRAIYYVIGIFQHIHQMSSKDENDYDHITGTEICQ